MSPETTTVNRRVLLVDAVNWSAAYPVSSPLRDVFAWFRRWVVGMAGISLEPISVQADLLAAVRCGVDGLIVSGSPRDAWNDDPANHKLIEVVSACRERRLPLLGVCYGHQILARALGGKVAPHPAGLELGNTPVRLTPAGLHSPLFRGFPAEFDALSSHSDAVLEMPAGAVLTVEGAIVENQGFQWGDRLFGVQFHPETDPEVLRFIWNQRLQVWQPRVSFDLPQRLMELRPTPQAALLLRNFMNFCLNPSD